MTIVPVMIYIRFSCYEYGERVKWACQKIRNVRKIKNKKVRNGPVRKQ